MPSRLLTFPIGLAMVLRLAAQGDASGFPVYLWVDARTIEASGVLESLSGLGFRGISMEAGQDPTRILAAGVPYYLDQVAGREVLSLTAEELEAGRGADPSAEVARARPTCLQDPGVQARIEQRLKELAARLASHPPDFVSIRDEPSFTRFLAPADWCADTACQVSYARYLVSQYGSPAALRHAHGEDALVVIAGTETAGWSLLPMATETARQRLFHSRPDQKALVAWNDARAFADAGFADALSRMMVAARSSFPGRPIGWLGGQMPSAFGGFDYERLLAGADLCEVYDVRGALETAASLYGPRRNLLATITAPTGPAENAALLVWSSFLRGADRLVLYSAREALDAERPGHATPWAIHALETARGVSSETWSGFRNARFEEADAAILIDQTSVRADWIFSTFGDGRTWIRRLGSYEAEHSPLARSREAWLRLLEDLGFRPKIITSAALQAGALNADRIRVLVLPRAWSLSREVTPLIRAFAERGGAVIADSHCGLFDEHLQFRARGPLDDTFGVCRTGTMRDLVVAATSKPRNVGLPYPIADATLHATHARPKDTASGLSAVLQSGRDGESGNRLCYLNLDIGTYPLDRASAHGRAEWLRAKLRTIFHTIEVKPWIEVEVQTNDSGRPFAWKVRRDAEGQRWLVLHDNGPPLTDPKDAEKLRAPTRAVLRFSQTVGITDVRTGKTARGVTAILGEWTPLSPGLWRLDKPQ